MLLFGVFFISEVEALNSVDLEPASVKPIKEINVTSLIAVSLKKPAQCIFSLSSFQYKKVLSS